MIIQHVIKGIGGITQSEADEVLKVGIVCNWWRNVNPLAASEIPQRLTERNLFWHQNRYSDWDPRESQPFLNNTPFISTTAGTVEREERDYPLVSRNSVHPAWLVALEFATDGWTRDAYLFHCYLFVLGKPSTEHEQFSEELRELNIYTGFSLYQPEGEITAKIIIPPAQIEKYGFYRIRSIESSLADRQVPIPDIEKINVDLYRPPEKLSNIRNVLS